MSELTVFLAISCWSGPFATFYQDLEWLRQHYRLQLCLIDNGAELPAALRKKLQPERQLTFSLRLHPSQVLDHCLSLPAESPLLLWWQAESQWNLKRLPLWIESLQTWTAIHPGFSSLSDPPIPDILPSRTHGFPACLLFEAAQIPVLRTWLSPQEQLPLMLLGVDPQGHLQSALPETPLSHEPALSPEEGMQRLQTLRKQPARALRKKILLESLQKAFPNSLKVLRELLPLLPLEEVLPILKTALDQRNFQPELLAWCSQALLATGQLEHAIQSKNCLDSLYPGFRLQLSPWPNQSLKSDFKGPQQDTLSILLLLESHSPESEVQRSLKSLVGLQANIQLVATGPPPVWYQPGETKLPLLSPRPAESPLQFHERIREHTQAQWFMLLQAGEELLADSLRPLQQWLWIPPVGCWGIQGSILHINNQGKALACHQEIRLFHRQTPLLPRVLPTPDPQAIKINSTLILHLKLEHSSAPMAYPRPQNLQQALKLAQQGYWKKALPILKKNICQTKDVSPQVYFTWMRALLETGAQHKLEAVWAEFPEALPRGPDFWYLRGAWLRRMQKAQEAQLALKRCLNFTMPELQQLEWYSPDCVNRLPLLELKQLYWQQLFLGSAEIGLRQTYIRELRSVLYQLYNYYPEGIVSPHEWSLDIYLSLTAILGAHYQPGSKARDLFLQSLPHGREQDLRIFYLETALLYLEGQFSLLADRLPPGQSYESMRELQQNPSYLLPFTAALWQQTEMDGPEIATAFLVTSALAYRDISYLLWLIHLQQEAGQEELAQFSLNTAREIFPEHILLPGSSPTAIS